MLRFYFEIEPARINQIENLQLFITVLFIIDVFINIFLYKKEYLKSTDILIDILSCLDFINVLKIFRLFRFSRIIKFLRFLRIMRLLKIARIFEQSSVKIQNLFNLIGICGLLFFILIGFFSANYVKDRLFKNERKSVYSFIKYSVENSLLENENNIDNFTNTLYLFKNLLSCDIALSNGNIYRFNILNKSNEEFNEFIKNKYFKEDILEIDYKNVKVKLAINTINRIVYRIEYYAIMFAILYYLVLFAIFYFVFSLKENE